MPMDDSGKRRALKVGLLGLLVAVGLATGLGVIVIAARCTSADGSAEGECRNASLHLERRLALVQGSLLQAEDLVSTCNRSLMHQGAFLEMKNSENLKQQEQIQELREENMKLSQKLQDTLAELEQLRTRKEVESNTRDSQSSGASALATPGLLVTAGLLLLGLGVPLP